MEIKSGNKVIPLSDSPLPVGMKMLFHSSHLKMQGDTALYTIKYKSATVSIVWRMTPDDLLAMDEIRSHPPNQCHLWAIDIPTLPTFLRQHS